MAIDWEGLSQLGLQIIGAATAPKQPDIDPFVPPEMPERKLKDFGPYITEMESMQADTALRMLSGELPQSVVDQIKTTVGESALRGGYGASETRTRNVLARDLGLGQLDIIQQGYGMANQLISRAQGRLQDAYAGDTAMANMAYDAWASSTNIMMDKYRNRANRHNELIEGITSTVAQSTQRRRIEQQESEADERFNRMLASTDSLRETLLDIQSGPRYGTTATITPSRSTLLSSLTEKQD
jgi:hypothetical protein